MVNKSAHVQGSWSKIEQPWYKRTLKQEEFVQADCIYVRSVGNQDRPLRVQRYEDWQESEIHLPHHHDELGGRMKWFFLDAQGLRRCFFTGTRYEDVKVGEDGSRLGRIRMLMSPLLPKFPPMHLRSAHIGGDATANVAPVRVSGNKALYKSVRVVLAAPLGGMDPMMVERILTSGGDTSVGKMAACLVGMFKTARKESEMKKVE